MESSVRIVVLLLLILGPQAQAQIEAIDDPVHDYASRYSDTTGDEVTNDNVMVRIVLDFNNDGVVDMALSDSREWGNAGGDWEIYIRRNDHKYQHLGTIMFHPDAFRIEPVREGVSRLIVYIHENAGAGDLYRFEISADSIALTSSRLLATGYDNPAGQKEYDRLFGYLHFKPVCEYMMVSAYLKNPALPWRPGY